MSLQDAIRFASLAHGDTEDKGKQPFIGHPLRVMARVARDHLMAPEYVLEGAVGHDILEDCPDTERADLAPFFSLKAIDVIVALTKSPDESYFMYIASVKAAGRVDDWIIKVKIADIEDNMDPRRQTKETRGLIKRYTEALAILRA